MKEIDKIQKGYDLLRSRESMLDTEYDSSCSENLKMLGFEIKLKENHVCYEGFRVIENITYQIKIQPCYNDVAKVYVLNIKSNKTLSKITNFKGKEINLNRFAYILETIYDIFNEFGININEIIIPRIENK